MIVVYLGKRTKETRSVNEIAVMNIDIQAQNALSADLFRRFIEYTDREPTTTKGYITCLRQFIRWMQENRITRPERHDIIFYKEYLNGEHFGRTGTKPLKAGTKQQYLRTERQILL